MSTRLCTITGNSTQHDCELVVKLTKQFRPATCFIEAKSACGQNTKWPVFSMTLTVAADDVEFFDELFEYWRWKGRIGTYRIAPSA